MDGPACIVRFMYFVLCLILCRPASSEDAVTTVQPDMNLLVDQVTLHLHTSPNQTNPEIIFHINDTDILDTTRIHSNNSFAFIIHGFHGAANESLFQDIKNAYLSRVDWTVIMVDWEIPSKVARYETAVKNAFMVAVLLAQWISKALVKGYMDASRMHIVGFSIGAHIAGNAGKRITGAKVAKIFALDPALPIYDKKNSTERLYIDDAEFVEVIHTCGNFISFDTNLGHADFYPNGGQFPQPDCLDPQSTKDVMGLEIITVMVCSHNMALKYFAESIYHEHEFTALRCDSWREFQNNNCSSTATAPMGYGTPAKTRGKYYLNLSLNSTIPKNDT